MALVEGLVVFITSSLMLRISSYLGTHMLARVYFMKMVILGKL